MPSVDLHYYNLPVHTPIQSDFFSWCRLSLDKLLATDITQI